MKHPIDPKIDRVFKALPGSDENSKLLVHFLNAVLADDLTAPIAAVEILNPSNDKEFLDDKLSVVDVKARGSHRSPDGSGLVRVDWGTNSLIPVRFMRATLMLSPIRREQTQLIVMGDHHASHRT